MKDPAEFVEDVFVPDMIHALTIRSPIANGSLVEIECPELPPSCCLIKAEHIPGKNRLADFPVPVLADKQLSYIGQPVALLAGPDESELEDLASGIDVITEEDEPVFSHDDKNPGAVIIKRSVISGEPDTFLGNCAKIVSGTYTTGIQEHWYPEPHGAVAVYDNETFTIHTSTQWPFHVRRSVAGVLGWDSAKVTIEAACIAMHLDGKIWYPSLVACHAALAAWITGRNVKLMLTREEDFMYSPKRNRTKITIDSALGEEGEILASSIKAELDLGADIVFEEEIMDHTCLGSLGAYNHRAYRIDGAGLRGNIPAQGPMAGFGLSQGFFAAERHISRIADSLGQDPAEWRRKNFVRQNQSLAVGTSLDDPVPLTELIDTVAAKSDYYRKWASYELLRKRGPMLQPGEPLRGIGISAAYQGNGFLHNDEEGGGNCTVEITLEKNGSLAVKTSLNPYKAGFPEVWKSLALEILDLDPALVRIANNAPEVPDAGPETLSRNITVVTGLVELCLKTIRQQRLSEEPPITVKQSSKPGKAPGWVPGKPINPEVFAHPGWGTAVAEIEIDPVSITPFIRGIWLAVDGGRIISERRARRVLRTGIIQALGWTCHEKLYYKEGKIPSHFYRSYDIPAPEEVPGIHIDFIKNSAPYPKGIGELPFSSVPAAYVQAVSQAMNHNFEEIPLRINDIWDAWKLRQTERFP